MCEAVFDLSSFSPRLVSSLFSAHEHQNNPDYRKVVETIVELVVSGYQLASAPGDTPDNTCIQVSIIKIGFCKFAANKSYVSSFFSAPYCFPCRGIFHHQLVGEAARCAVLAIPRLQELMSFATCT